MFVYTFYVYLNRHVDVFNFYSKVQYSEHNLVTK